VENDRTPSLLGAADKWDSPRFLTVFNTSAGFRFRASSASRPTAGHACHWAARNSSVCTEGDTMTLTRIAALLYAIISLAVVAFQIALAVGAPWGAFAMGGAFPGQFPPALRIAALIQAALLLGMAVIVLARADLILPKWSRVSRWLIWFVVAFAALSLVLNLITPSAGERAIWAPTAFLLLISSGIVAFTRPSERAA